MKSRRSGLLQWSAGVGVAFMVPALGGCDQVCGDSNVDERVPVVVHVRSIDGLDEALATVDRAIEQVDAVQLSVWGAMVHEFGMHVPAPVHDLEAGGYELDTDGIHVLFVDAIVDTRTGMASGGYHTTADPCVRHMFVDHRPRTDRVIAHEVGHQLGLDHVDDRTNLMYPGPLTEAREFTATQRDQMLVGAQAFACGCDFSALG